ncbi:hypothetical protein O2K51_07015 [Apibacter raozihei]|uniref:hypothetical protein n=1 Tax=Apibacter raozihei TaxID=2500547 RepID=UPI000FE412DE|nr:hypothetical protein [Apibacter raozihei]
MLLLSPSLVVFLLMGTYFNGHNLDINNIVDSWKVFGGEYLDKISNLYWTFKTTDEVIIWKIPFFRDNPVYLMLFFVNLIIIFLSMLVYLNKNFQTKSKFLFTFLLFQYLAIAFTSLIAIDYVRWFCMANLITIFTLIYVDPGKSFFNIISFKIPTKINNYNKFILLFIGLPLGGQWSPTQYIYSMPIKHFFDFGYRLITIFN